MNAQDEVDRVLEALRARMPDAHGDGGAPPADAALAAARARLLAEIGAAPSASGPRRRRLPKLLLAASTVVAVGIGAMLVGLPGTGPASAQARAVLERAARSTVDAVDPPLGPDQYRYVGTHAWWLSMTEGGGAPLSALVEHRIDHWVPADPTGDWLLDRAATGRLTPLQGSEAEFRETGVLDGSPQERLTARCGAFYGAGSDQCTGPGSWQVPTPEFIAGLPRDPEELFARLDADAPENSRGAAELLVYAADLLRGPLLVPADVRAALYEALTRVDGLTVTPGAVDLDGRPGTALGIDDATSRMEIIIDPVTGTFIGEREVTRTDLDGLPAGTVTSQTSVTQAVVDELGEVPPG
jgi:hypothetical protein